MTRTTKRPIRPARDPVGQRVAVAREALGVALDVLARATGIAADRLHDIESGAAIEPPELVQLADLLGRTVRELERGPLGILPEDRVATARFRISRRQGGRKATTEDPAERAAIARNLRIYRDALGLSQSEAARRMGLASPSVVNTHEAGTKGVSSENLIRYAALYGCMVADLKRPSVVVVRTKLAGDVADLSPERRAALEREIADFDRRVNTRLLDEIEAAQKRRR